MGKTVTLILAKSKTLVKLSPQGPRPMARTGRARACGNSTHHKPTKSPCATQLNGYRKCNVYKPLTLPIILSIWDSSHSLLKQLLSFF